MSQAFMGGPRGLATLLLALTALTGALGGVALDRLLLRPDAAVLSAEEARPEAQVETQERRALRVAPRERFLVRMADELDLSEEQRVRLDSLLAAQQERTRAAMQEMQPRMRVIVAETRRGVDEILTPEQRERLRELRSEQVHRERPHRERRGPRGPRAPR
jgi:hypothetical protein